MKINNRLYIFHKFLIGVCKLHMEPRMFVSTSSGLRPIQGTAPKNFFVLILFSSLELLFCSVLFYGNESNGTKPDFIPLVRLY
jgi:hypothetical protein